ncbi:hypothetical protein HanRHA438_Chr08g0368671 [Helianthus annuus]|nr:hypothetical protein HanRHA438_Chr08g0368671 [Helianthus annuus]
MPDPSTASSQAKTREQKAEHAPCSMNTGACPRVCRKDKVVEASISQHGGMPSGHGVVVNAKIRRIQANLDSIDTLLHTGPCPSDMGAWSNNEDKLHLMKKEKMDGHGAMPNGHEVVSGLLCRL